MSAHALLIPVEGPVEEVQLDGSLEQLQRLVGGGLVQALPMPRVGIPEQVRAVSSVLCNEDMVGHDPETGERVALLPNLRATDFMVPGVGLRFGDCVRGPVLLVGHDWRGEWADVPALVAARARLIEREAAGAC